jgi:hypothetical protein
MGSWIGFAGGLFLYSLVISRFAGEYADYALAATLTLSIIAGVALFCFIYKHAFIIATALLGAYALVRGASVYIGGFPNEFTLYSELKYGLLESVPWSYFVYFIIIFGLTIFGIFFQYGKVVENWGAKLDSDSDEKYDHRQPLLKQH